jgi:exodeoxyribonuclease V alpha subunit
VVDGWVSPRSLEGLDASQRRVARAMAGEFGLLVIEGAAGAGKTATLRAAGLNLNPSVNLIVVTPTLKAAQVANQQLWNAGAFSALEAVHRFADPDYADLSLLMRTGERAGEVFDTLLDRGQIVVHPSEVERQQALTTLDIQGKGLVIADTREQVTTLNAAIHDHRQPTQATTDQGIAHHVLTTTAGEQIGIGDRVATRLNDRDLDVANRDTWTVTHIDAGGALLVHGRSGERVLPADYVREHVELAYATTAYGAQGETVDQAHFALAEKTGAASAYVAMTRGRHHNTAHLVAENLDEARQQWVDVFTRDRADLGPAQAATRALEDIERYGPQLSPEPYRSPARTRPGHRPQVRPDGMRR